MWGIILGISSQKFIDLFLNQYVLTSTYCSIKKYNNKRDDIKLQYNIIISSSSI